MILARRRGLSAALIIYSLCFFANPARAQEKVRLAHSALESSNSVWYLAKERGLYKKYGLDADLLFIPSTTTSVSSLVAGDVQVANASGGGVASAVVAGADLVMVACYLNSLPYELVVSESVKSAEDLKGSRCRLCKSAGQRSAPRRFAPVESPVSRPRRELFT